MMKYRRILLKLSGELIGNEEYGFSKEFLDFISDEILNLKKNYDIDISIVVGGGNIIRGNDAHLYGIDKTTADYMGMLATVLNALALQSILESKGLETRVMTSIEIKSVAEPYIRRRAIRHLEKGRIVIFAGGTGSPFFSTDTAGALRAIEIRADALLKGTKVDGVYNKDPKKYLDAQKYEYLDYNYFLSNDIKVMDAAAIALCRENNLPVIVFNISQKGAIEKIIKGENVGTLIYSFK